MENQELKPELDFSFNITAETVGRLIKLLIFIGIISLTVVGFAKCTEYSAAVNGASYYNTSSHGNNYYNGSSEPYYDYDY